MHLQAQIQGLFFLLLLSHVSSKCVLGLCIGASAHGPELRIYQGLVRVLA